MHPHIDHCYLKSMCAIETCPKVMHRHHHAPSQHCLRDAQAYYFANKESIDNSRPHASTLYCQVKRLTGFRMEHQVNKHVNNATARLILLTYIGLFDDRGWMVDNCVYILVYMADAGIESTTQTSSAHLIATAAEYGDKIVDWVIGKSNKHFAEKRSRK